MNRIQPGQRFNRLTFVRLAGRAPDKHLRGLWECDCGKSHFVIVSRVVNGYCQSCGCLSTETKPGLTHGQTDSPTYSSWQAMKGRCLNPEHKDYPRWGAKGVTVCDRWLSFENFLADMGERPAGTSIDRWPNFRGNYEPGNCRWATPEQQARNRFDFTMVRTPLGVMGLIDYAREIGITKGAAHWRLKRGTLEGCERCA